MQRKETMRQMAPFDIPDHYPNVLRWFKETLETYTEVEYQGTPWMKLHMIGPRTTRISGPDGDVSVDEIVMLGIRTSGPLIPTDWPGCFAEGERVREPLGPVMEFQFLPIRGGTSVSASYDHSLATVGWLFEKFVTEEIEKRYPAIGGLWQKHEEELERQRREISDRHRQTKSGAVGAETGATTEGGAGMRADNARGAQDAQKQSDPLAVIENEDYREMVRMWNEGYTEQDIGERYMRSPGTVGNVMSQLRKQHGSEVVKWHK